MTTGPASSDTALTEAVLSEADLGHLRAAIAVAAAAGAAGEPPYGSLLVDQAGTVVGTEHNTVRSSGDITAHPELKLARWAALTYPPSRCAQLTLYTSCQPCPMCTNAIARAHLGRVVYALSTDQLHELQPPDQPHPDAADVRYDGPALFAEAARPIRHQSAAGPGGSAADAAQSRLPSRDEPDLNPTQK